MQKLDMSSYGVEELDANEMKNLDGGNIIDESVFKSCLEIIRAIRINIGRTNIGSIISAIAGGLAMRGIICIW